MGDGENKIMIACLRTGGDEIRQRGEAAQMKLITSI